jgi:hypothetical protein
MCKNTFICVVQLNFPTYNFNIKRQENVNYIFDIIRKKWVLLTAEEWVRQHALHYLLYTKNYPASLVAVEREFSVNGLKKRFDILIFNRNHKPQLIVECKRSDVPLDEGVMKQISVYNSTFQATCLWITNGIQHMFVQYAHDFSSYNSLTELPDPL